MNTTDRDFALPTLGAGLLLLAPVFLAARTGVDPGTVAADRALETLTSLTLPGICLVALHSLTDRTRRDHENLLVRLGSDRRRAFVAGFAARLVFALGLHGIFTATALAFARTPSDPRFVSDLAHTLPATALGVFAVLAVAGAGVTWFGRTGLFVALGASWALGHLDFPIALGTPFGHLRHLLGLGAAQPIATVAASISLACFGVAFAALGYLRVPR